MEFVNNIQNNAENELRISAENSPSSKVGKVLMKVRMLLCLEELDWKLNLSVTMS